MRPLASPQAVRLADDFEKLSSFRDPGQPGWTRRVFSRLDSDARDFVAGRMKDAGLVVEADSAANLIGRLPGSASSSAPIVTGSHTDTVRGGGRFDGIVGVLGAIEAVRCLRDSGTELAHDLVVIDFLGEEPNDFGLSCVGSRAIAGTLDERHLALRDSGGGTLGAALEACGGRPAELDQARWRGGTHCYVELHIEQGPVLEQARVPIGVVTGIVGIRRLFTQLTGQPDHAGTTPMNRRRDALLGAAEVALAAERLASGGVATTGRLEVRPGANNVVPAEAELWTEARSAEQAWLGEFERALGEQIAAIAERRHLGASLDWVSRVPPVPVTPWVADAIEKAARSLQIDPLSIPSGAGHDASQIARLGPMGMIFVPSRGGRSHCPEEWTDLDDIATGVAVLAEAVKICDHHDDISSIDIEGGAYGG